MTCSMNSSLFHTQRDLAGKGNWTMTMNLATVLARTSRRSRTLCLAERAGSVSNAPAFFLISHLSNPPGGGGGECRRRKGQFSWSEWFTWKQFQFYFWFLLPEGVQIGPCAPKDAQGSRKGLRLSLRACSPRSGAPLPASPSRGRRSLMLWARNYLHNH